MQKYKINEPFPIFSNKQIQKFMEKIQKEKNIKIVSSEVEPNLLDVSLSIKLRGSKEDECYIENNDYRINIRRGMSVYLFNDIYLIARKGLQKFFYLNYTALDPNAKEVPKSYEKKRGKKNKKSSNDYTNMIKNIIFQDITDAFEQTYQVKSL